MKSIENKTKRTTFFIAGFLILAAIILALGYLYCGYAVKSHQVQIDQELSAIADLKEKEIRQWREERLGDVSVFYKNDVFSSLVQRYFEKPDDAETLKRIQVWLGNVQIHYDYKRVCLVDSKGVERLSIPKATTPVVAAISRRYSEIMKSKQVVFEDFYRNEHDNQIYLTVLAPIIDNQDSTHVLGVISLQIDPEHYLYPLISSWPTPSKTSETLILRREGDEVVFLNSLKFKKDAALNLRMPMNGKLAIPAIRAALGEEGIVEALDYRGVPVIAEIRTIHGSPWFMVARMDQTEAYAPLRERLWILTFFVGLLLIGMGAGFGFIWKQQSVRFYRERFEASKKLRESKERYESLVQTSIDGFWVADTEGHILEVNDAYCLMTGYPKGKILTMRIRDLEAVETPEITREHIEKIIASGGFDRFESKHRRADGKIIDVIISTIYLPSQNIFLVFVNNITDRKQAEEDLARSEENFRLLFDTIPDAIFIHDLEKHILQVNSVACKRLGYSNEELLKMTVNEIDSPKFTTGLEERMSQFLQTGHAIIEVEHISKDGVIIPTELSSRLIEYEGKQAVLSVARDITQRKQKEKQLIIQSTALNAAANAIVITNISGEIEWINPAFTKLTGYTFEEVTGENPRTIKSGKHDAAFYRNLWDTILAGKVWHGEMINKRKDGSEYTEEMTITPLKDENGELIRFIAIKKDVTERNQAAEEIKKLQQQIDYIFGATKTGLHIVDVDFNLNYVSPALQQIYGNYTGRKCYEYYKGFDEACEECLVKQAIETGLSVQYETTYPRENNRHVQATTIPFKDKDGKWLAAEVTVDITERKKFEEELSIAKAEAERANIAKSEFLSRMSHELRTPMNSILGFAQLMDMGELKPAHKKGVDHILKSGKHLLGLINEVLNLSRIEAGKLSISLEPVQLRGIILETMDIVRPLAAERNLTLQLSDSSYNDLFAVADRQGLKQVLLNLTSNAVKYNRDGGSVKVECEQLHPENKPMVRISIIDTGNGIDPESIAKLFTPFERIGADQTKTEGTGLGLTITRKLIEAMHGTIGVESEVGVGSTFWVELPQAEGQLDRHERLSDQIIPEQGKALVSGTILYFEDNISNLQLVEHILEEHRPGVRLITEMYGRNAVKCATDYAPDIILLDLDLPDIHGREVLKLLQAKSKTAAIPVVILSADAMSHSVEQLMKAGAKNYLTKPLDVMEFLRLVDEFLSRE